jgi:acyl-coenzyme A thioesterase PaaI-like protein
MSLTELLDSWPEKFRDHPEGAELPSHHDHCLGCGAQNPHGHHLRVFSESDGVVATHTFDDRHVGAPGIAHGGAVATVFDDLLGFLLYKVGQPAVTRSLTIDYLAPVLLEVPYQLAAKITGAEGRKLFVEAAVTGAAGEAVARARALFLLVDVAHFSKHAGGPG